MNQVFKDCSNLVRPIPQTPSPSKPVLQNVGSVNVVIFYGVSCMGKTTFSRLLEEKARSKNSNYLWTSFDKHGSSILKRHEEEHPEITNSEDRFFAVWGEILNKFNSSIVETIESQI